MTKPTVSKQTVLCEITRNDGHQDIDFGINRKPEYPAVYSLLVVNTNLCPVSHRFRVIASVFRYSTPSFGRNRWTLDYEIWLQKQTKASLYRVVHTISEHIVSAPAVSAFKKSFIPVKISFCVVFMSNV